MFKNECGYFGVFLISDVVKVAPKYSAILRTNFVVKFTKPFNYIRLTVELLCNNAFAFFYISFKSIVFLYALIFSFLSIFCGS